MVAKIVLKCKERMGGAKQDNSSDTGFIGGVSWAILSIWAEHLREEAVEWVHLDLVADGVDIQSKELLELHLGWEAVTLVETMVILCFASTECQSCSELKEFIYHHSQIAPTLKLTIAIDE